MVAMIEHGRRTKEIKPWTIHTKPLLMTQWAKYLVRKADNTFNLDSSWVTSKMITNSFDATLKNLIAAVDDERRKQYRAEVTRLVEDYKLKEALLGHPMSPKERKEF